MICGLVLHVPSDTANSILYITIRPLNVAFCFHYKVNWCEGYHNKNTDKMIHPRIQRLKPDQQMMLWRMSGLIMKVPREDPSPGDDHSWWMLPSFILQHSYSMLWNWRDRKAENSSLLRSPYNSKWSKKNIIMSMESGTLMVVIIPW